jgi:hypothetical protein
MMMMMPKYIFFEQIYCKNIEGLQSLCAILAAQGIMSTVPIPYEPSGYLVIPAVLLYFARATYNEVLGIVELAAFKIVVILRE